jgi:DNA-binding CsgD family transcriptional regulator
MAVIFTVIMLEGKRLFVMVALELLVYVGVCVIAYNYPQTVHDFAGEREILADVLTGVILVSVLLGITLLKHFTLYREQQRKLEAAREEALRLINNILDIIKIETGNTGSGGEPYQTAELSGSLTAMGKEAAERMDLSLAIARIKNYLENEARLRSLKTEQGARRRGGKKPEYISPLTPWEKKIALLAQERLTQKEIAEQLSLSENTVHTAINVIFSKLGIHSKRELAELNLE